MSGNIENQQISNILSDIFDLKSYPDSLKVKNDFCASILLSEHYCSQNEYIDQSVLKDIKIISDGESVSMFSLDYYLKGELKFEMVYSGGLEALDVDCVCDEMQCYSFIIIMPSNDYIVGLDEEVVIFISRVNTGLISKLGGVSYFEQCFNRQRVSISTPLDTKVIDNLGSIFYKNIRTC
uniref:Uncharacterized protein n=1 Tax=Shewanella putrefaciens (strain 200) TaxID=399804 RepID=E6XHD5_SHEP2